jgi:hypothetical protein
VVAQRMVGGVDALAREQFFDQIFARDHPVRAEQEQRQERTLLRAPDRDRDTSPLVHASGPRISNSRRVAAIAPPRVSLLSDLRAQPGKSALGQLWDMPGRTIGGDERRLSCNDSTSPRLGLAPLAAILVIAFAAGPARAERGIRPVEPAGTYMTTIVKQKLANEYGLAWQSLYPPHQRVATLEAVRRLREPSCRGRAR